MGAVAVGAAAVVLGWTREADAVGDEAKEPEAQPQLTTLTLSRSASYVGQVDEQGRPHGRGRLVSRAKGQR